LYHLNPQHIHLQIMQKTIFITGIDTGVGKTVVTALLAKHLHTKGEKVITQKLVQTGCEGMAEDILTHRKIMGIDLLPEDLNQTTCNYVFRFPASPHLAAKLENRSINVHEIEAATAMLQIDYDWVLVEGVGGICVPLTNQLTLIDYLSGKDYSVVVVTSSKLGSINHTLLTLEVARQRNLNIAGLIYKHLPDETAEIATDSVDVFRQQLEKMGYNQNILELPYFDVENISIEAFSFPIERFLRGME